MATYKAAALLFLACFALKTFANDFNLPCKLVDRYSNGVKDVGIPLGDPCAYPISIDDSKRTAFNASTDGTGVAIVSRCYLKTNVFAQYCTAVLHGGAGTGFCSWPATGATGKVYNRVMQHQTASGNISVTACEASGCKCDASDINTQTTYYGANLTALATIFKEQNGPNPSARPSPPSTENRRQECRQECSLPVELTHDNPQGNKTPMMYNETFRGICSGNQRLNEKCAEKPGCVCPGVYIHSRQPCNNGKDFGVRGVAQTSLCVAKPSGKCSNYGGQCMCHKHQGAATCKTLLFPVSAKIWDKENCNPKCSMVDWLGKEVDWSQRKQGNRNGNVELQTFESGWALSGGKCDGIDNSTLTIYHGALRAPATNETALATALPAPANIEPAPAITPPAPATALPAPDTALPAPAITLPAPATALPASATALPAPATALPAPAVTLPAPATALPAPAITLPAPATALPAPAITLPAPATALLAPATTLPAPATALPAPATALPAPALTLPAPATALPAPTTALPAPALTLPAPATAPATALPVPAITLPAPATALPAPAITLPAPATALPAPAADLMAPVTDPIIVKEQSCPDPGPPPSPYPPPPHRLIIEPIIMFSCIRPADMAHNVSAGCVIAADESDNPSHMARCRAAFKVPPTGSGPSHSRAPGQPRASPAPGSASANPRAPVLTANHPPGSTPPTSSRLPAQTSPPPSASSPSEASKVTSDKGRQMADQLCGYLKFEACQHMTVVPWAMMTCLAGHLATDHLPGKSQLFPGNQLHSGKLHIGLTAVLSVPRVPWPPPCLMDFGQWPGILSYVVWANMIPMSPFLLHKVRQVRLVQTSRILWRSCLY